MGQSSNLSRHLRVVGRSAAACFGDFGSSILLGVYEGQPASAKLHIKLKKPTVRIPPKIQWLYINLYLFMIKNVKRKCPSRFTLLVKRD